MTLWQRIYSMLGGKPPKASDRGHDGLPKKIDLASLVAWRLTSMGFLKRDAALPNREAIWFWNYRWQWRFWRGASSARPRPPP